MSTVLSERRGSILVVTLNRPDRLNAIDNVMRGELRQAWESAADPEVRAMVITGVGRGFCAGADLRSCDAESTADSGTAQTLRYTYNPEVLALTSLRKPVIAAVNGPAAGAGLGLALCADIRIASVAAKFVPSFVNAGVIPDMGATFFAVRALGYTTAFDWLAGGSTWSAEEALRRGLVQEVVEPTDLLDAAIARAQRFADLPAAAVGLTKVALARAYSATLADQLECDAQLQAEALADPGRIAARAAVFAKISSTADKRQTPPLTTT